jgi:cell division protein FtsL
MNLKDYMEQVQLNIPMLVMVALVIVSSVGVIYSKHMNRNEFIQLQKLERQRDLLNEEWGRLLLE